MLLNEDIVEILFENLSILSKTLVFGKLSMATGKTIFFYNGLHCLHCKNSKIADYEKNFKSNPLEIDAQLTKLI